MHLVVPTHPYFFWVVSHANKTLPSKKSEQEPQNMFSLPPTAKPYPLLPLTHDPPLPHWLGTGWWYMGLARTSIPCMSKACLLLIRLSWSGGSSVHSAAHLWPLMAWTIFWFLIPHGLLLLRARPCLTVGFSFFILLFFSFRSRATIPARLLCYYCCSVIWPQLVGLLLGLLHIPFSSGYKDPVWSLDLCLCYFGLSWPITLFVSSFVPFFFLFEHPWPIF